MPFGNVMKNDIQGLTFGKPVFIIAELSANHHHDLEIVKKTIKAMKKSGADAIKLQTYLPETMTLNIDDPLFKASEGSIWKGRNLFDLYKEAYLPWDWHTEIFKVAKEEGLYCFSSPFDHSAVDFLEQFNPPAYKIASLEITDIPLIKYVASKGRPIIISTGVAEFSDIKLAVETCRNAGNEQITLLKCTSAYPTPMQEVNLRVIPHIKETFKTPVGLSDHTLGWTVPVGAVALGACMIEKHFILDRKLGGPDASFSMEPDEFKEMVSAVRDTEKALGEVTYSLTPKMQKARTRARSLFAVKDICSGEVLSEQNVRSIRPGHGLHPKYYESILGKKAIYNIEKGTPLEWKLFH